MEHHALNGANPPLEDVIRQIAAATWLSPAPSGLNSEVKRAVDLVLFQQALALGNDEHGSPVVCATVLATLQSLQPRLPEYLTRVL